MNWYISASVPLRLFFLNPEKHIYLFASHVFCIFQAHWYILDSDEFLQLAILADIWQNGGWTIRLPLL